MLVRFPFDDEVVLHDEGRSGAAVVVVEMTVATPGRPADETTGGTAPGTAAGTTPAGTTPAGTTPARTTGSPSTVALWVRAEAGVLRGLPIAGADELPEGIVEAELRPCEGVEVPLNAASMRRALRRGGTITDANHWRLTRTRPLAYPVPDGDLAGDR